MHAEKYYSDDTGTLKLKYSSSKKVCRVATPCTSYSLNTHTPPPNSCPPNGTNRTFSYIFYIKYLYFKFLNCSGLKSGYNWKYALEMRNRYTLCEYISCLMIRHISSFWVATWCNRSPAKVHSPKSSRRQH